ncbi:UNVERIFIED_CONTAM: hypothetical protein GTU68_023302 [Idotea baltica]|nr:hypothetical protein [Idotea baltica]
MDTIAPSKESRLGYLGLQNVNAQWNLPPAKLTEITLSLGQGQLSDSGALAIDTGEFTGRSPKDRFIVKDDLTSDLVDWGEINIPFESDKFDALYNKVINYLEDKDVYVRDAFACTNNEYKTNVRVVNEHPWQNMFVYNMFIRPKANELEGFTPEWHVIAAPGFVADPSVDGTRQHNFAVISFSKKTVIIGGTAYTGEIKKSIFSILNFILPTQKNVLSMHCSSNVGEREDTAIFFGLSGTGKTTLSADPNRRLIGDDEHGWAEGSVFNFEGGCYAKCINLNAEQEPQIFGAIKFGALLENINFHSGTRTVDFENVDKTQNTRVSYPIYHIDNIVRTQMGGNPKNIFFLTADAFGVLPPISKLNAGQAMYHFISGYTAKVAGTEEGVVEPQATFSACFGAPFLPLHPTYYAEMLGRKLEEHKVNVWLVNTGWTAGPYGEGYRMKLPHTRAMITAALNGVLGNIAYDIDPVFGLGMPIKCPGVKSELLNPRNTWKDKSAYDAKASELANKFNDNFKQFAAKATDEILKGGPVLK